MARTSQQLHNYKGGRNEKIGMRCTPQIKEKFLQVVQAQDITQADWIEYLVLNRLPGYHPTDNREQEETPVKRIRRDARTRAEILNQINRMRAEGLTDKVIGRKLGVSFATVRSYAGSRRANPELHGVSSERIPPKGGRTIRVVVRCTPDVKMLFRRVGDSTQGDIFEQFVLEDWGKLTGLH